MVNFCISSDSGIFLAGFGLSDVSIRHNANPPAVAINVNTINGRMADINVNEPINDAVSRQIRPQIVHDSIKDFRYFGATNSAVLESNVTSVIDTNILISNANANTSTGLVLFLTEIEKLNKNRTWTHTTIYYTHIHRRRPIKRAPQCHQIHLAVQCVAIFVLCQR